MARSTEENSHQTTVLRPVQSPNSLSTAASLNERRNRRKRLQLSCGECRKKKLSCDRTLPCKRCLRAGRPEECSFETRSAQPLALSKQYTPSYSEGHSDEIQDLRTEVAQLKRLLAEVHLKRSENDPEITHNPEKAKFNQALLQTKIIEDQNFAIAPKTALSDPREKSPRGYYYQHTLLQFFREIPQLFPFIKETTDELLTPLGVNLQKNKFAKNNWKTNNISLNGNPLEILLPPKNHTDELVSFYLCHFEQLHRIVHIPTFNRDYTDFWVAGNPRHTAITALILCMISISTCASTGAIDPSSTSSKYRAMPVQWISACDEWLRQQSSKCRTLIHYQISCLVYLSKRMNIIGKKRYWKETGSLIQDAIIDGLHCDPSTTLDSPYTKEMKRRIWTVLRELDLQNSLDYGLPSLLYSIDSNVAAPANINDIDFNEASTSLPRSRPLSQFTETSYQHHCSRNWKLRLEISQHLFSTAGSKTLNYDDVLRYTHKLTQTMHSISPWDSDEMQSPENQKIPIITYAYLHFQLKEFILAIHRPYLQNKDGNFWLSENICYQMSRDILLMNTKLGELGLQSLTLLREDLLLASLKITRIILLQPKGSNGIITTTSDSIIDLLEQCSRFLEDRYMRCFLGEPWCFMTICAAIMLLKIHLRKETRQRAKTTCAQRFLHLHYKHVARQQSCLLNHQESQSQDCTNNSNVLTAPKESLSNEAPEWPDNSYSEMVVNPFDLDMELDGIWEAWGSEGI